VRDSSGWLLQVVIHGHYSPFSLGGRMYTRHITALIACFEERCNVNPNILAELASCPRMQVLSDAVFWKLSEMCVIGHKVIDAHRRQQEF